MTRNLRADMIDKVQVYDKKSEQSTFTGVDDGNQEKVVDVKLKSDKKNGYFGKLEAGIATDDYFRAKALFNKFTSRQKFSAYAIWGSDGVTGLGWQDEGKYASSQDRSLALSVMQPELVPTDTLPGSAVTRLGDARAARCAVGATRLKATGSLK